MVTDLLIPLTLKVSVALVAAWTLCRAMAGSSAASRHLVWTLAVVSMLALPAVHLLGPRWNLTILPLQTTVPVVQSPPAHAVARMNGMPQSEMRSSVPAPAEPRERIETGGTTSWTDLDWAWIPLTVWIGGMAAGLLRFMRGLVSVRRIMRRASRVSDPHWTASLGDAVAALRLTRPVQLKSSADTTIPVACGVLTPTILLPPDANSWPADRRRVVLLHELAHVRRRDCLVQCVAQIARAVHWFNPLVHVAISRLRAEQERACDDLVLAAGTDGPLYADHLIDIACCASMSVRSPAWVVLAMAHRSNLEGRLMAILNDRNRRPPARWVRMMVASAGAAAIGLLGGLQLTAAAGRADIQSSEPSRTELPIGKNALPAGVALPPYSNTRTDAERVLQSSSSSPRSPAEPQPTPRIVDPPPLDSNPDPDAKPDPMPNPRPRAQLKGGSRLQSAEVSDETRRRVATALETALADDNEDVRVQALWALGGTRDERAIPGLLKAARDASPRVRMAALSALVQFSTADATDGIVAALEDSDADVRALAVRYVSGLVRKGSLNDAKAVPTLLPLLKDASVDVRKFTAAALGDIADPRAVDALTAALKDNDSEVRERAARALGQIARGQRAARVIPPPPPPPAPLPGASLLPPGPPRVELDLDAIKEFVSQAQEEARRNMEAFERDAQELRRQQEELRRQLR